ncbi:AraC family transcriptional regulator ligand-binding domain-containing protein [Variovorax sp. RCC_210]|uniref:AraC family transcriptional regulator n=1 Tax=Variovorax sp. RCC_210 TaxID=3239217 RepID=UPI0035258CEC
MQLKDQIILPAFVPALAAAHGLDMHRLLHAAGLPQSLFHAGKASVTTRQYFGLWRAIEGMGLPADFGMQLGARHMPGRYDVATVAALHSANFAEAIAKISRYKRIVCPAVWTLATRGEETSLESQWLLSEEPVPAYLSEGGFASIVRLFSLGTGGARLAPHRLEFTRAHGNVEMLAQHFGCEVRFGAPRDLLVFSRSKLDEPFLSHNPELLELMIPGLETALREHMAQPSLIERVQASIAAHMQGQRPAMAAIASELCMSSRTLQRRLAMDGTSYQQLLDGIRRSSACKMLEATTLELGEIAFLLGFEELNSFQRAFQAWEGVTPVRWRAARLGSGRS